MLLQCTPIDRLFVHIDSGTFQQRAKAPQKKENKMFNPIKTTAVVKSRFDIDLSDEREYTDEELVDIINSCGNWWKAAYTKWGASGALADEANELAHYVAEDTDRMARLMIKTDSNWDTNHWCFAVVAATELAIRVHADVLSSAEISYSRIEAYKAAKAMWDAVGYEVPSDEVVHGHKYVEL